MEGVRGLMPLTPVQRRDLERILHDLTEVQATMFRDGVTTYKGDDVLPGLEDVEGHIGEARGLIALALGRNTP